MPRTKILLVLIFLMFNSSSHQRTDFIESDKCNQNLWNYIYSSDRLEVVEQCIEIVATVTGTTQEHDGDLTIAVELQSPFYYRHGDFEYHQKDLYTELICHAEPEDPYIKEVCGDSGKNPQKIPEVGDRVRIIGSFVYDISHSYPEIHPISKLEILSKR
jgi:hypothetical protein